MIVFDLKCRAGHRFEGWFGSSQDFTAQQQRGLVACPQCQSVEVLKAPMAPNLARKGNQVDGAVALPPSPATPPPLAAQAMVPAGPPPVIAPEAMAMMQALVRMQAEALKSSRWVGGKFAEDARAMHYGEQDQAAIHGEATAQDVQELLEEGIEIAPVLFPLSPPDKVN